MVPSNLGGGGDESVSRGHDLLPREALINDGIPRGLRRLDGLESKTGGGVREAVGVVGDGGRDFAGVVAAFSGEVP